MEQQAALQVVFVHKPSGTLIAADLIWDYPGSGTPKGTQAWKFGMDRVYLPFYKRFMIKDKGLTTAPCGVGISDNVLAFCVVPAAGVTLLHVHMPDCWMRTYSQKSVPLAVPCRGV